MGSRRRRRRHHVRSQSQRHNRNSRSRSFARRLFPPIQSSLQIPGRNSVPGVTLHPSGALLYQPFLTGPAGNAGVNGGIDILDAHSGLLRLRILLQQQFMTDVDGLHGSFLATDENGQRLFAITSKDGTVQNAGITVVQLANVPLGIGTLTPASGPAAGGTTLTIRGSGFRKRHHRLPSAENPPQSPSKT